MIRYRVGVDPEVMLACDDHRHRALVGLTERASRTIERCELVNEVTVPLFFDGDYDGGLLFEAIHSAMNAVYRDVGRPPETVLLGRFTFVEICAHLYNGAIGRGRRFGGPIMLGNFETGRMELFGVSMLAASGADHFVAAQPPLTYLMSRGVPPGAVVLRTS